jgi:hypothetical protein
VSPDVEAPLIADLRLPPPQRRTSRATVAMVSACLVLAVAIPVGWWTWSGHNAAQLVVSWEPTCTGTEVSTYDASEAQLERDELQGQYVIDARPGFSCTVMITVHNGSRRTAHLTSVQAAFLGPKGGAEVMGGTTDDLPALSSQPTDDVDGRYPLARDLRAGATTTIELAVQWREKGCNSGDYLWAGPWPIIAFDMLGRSYHVAPPQYLVLHTHDGDHVHHGGQRATC